MSETTAPAPRDHVLTNIFRLSEFVSLEDRFTAAWGYVLDRQPALAQAIAEVLANPFYLKPEGKDHFRWSDFYAAVRSQPGSLAQEFADYMKSLGMAPFTLKNAEDIFDKRVKPLQFEEAVWLAANKAFVERNPGCWLKRIPTGLGCEVHKPSANLTLIYIWAEQRSSYAPECHGPTLAVNVYEHDALCRTVPENSNATTQSGISVYRRRLENGLKQGEGIFRLTYAAPLVEIIQETKESTVQAMTDILALVRADI
jgi:hypothetical protein